VRPARGDFVAGTGVALVLVPHAMAYAEIAGVDPVYGLYAAVAGPLAGALVGSSPYLQTGPVAVTSLLTFGALSSLAEPFTARFALLAGVLAIAVGVIRLIIGVVGAGPVAYLMSQPVVVSFTSAAAVLIIASQVPSFLGVDSQTGNPVAAAILALGAPDAWSLSDVVLGGFAIAAIIGGRRISPLFPGAFLAVTTATIWSATVRYDGQVVGAIPLELKLETSLPWGELGDLAVPALVIALVGFAEPAAIARRYAAEDRTPWDSNREFIGQGLANIASGVAGGYPVGGSFSRTALNRLGGARTRWSGAITGLTVLAILPMAGLLSALPKAVLAGLVIAAALSLIDLRAPCRYWRWSKLQFSVGVATATGTLVFAPAVERGVLLGVGMALAVHLWREFQVSVPSDVRNGTLHLWPSGVLYFGSAPGMERAVNRLLAQHGDLSRLTVHLDALGRVDLTGALMLHDLVEEAHASGMEVDLCGARPHSLPILSRVLGDLIPLRGTTSAESHHRERERPTDQAPSYDG
jgi:sulfate permease, SulP family